MSFATGLATSIASYQPCCAASVFHATLKLPLSIALGASYAGVSRPVGRAIARLPVFAKGKFSRYKALI